ncbi:MAG: hypothetical protein ACI392_05790 [Paludibacteraceae bacterium]
MKKFTFLVAALCATMMASAATVTVTMSDLAATSGTKDGVTISTTKGTSNDPIYSDSGKDLRVYAGGTITIEYTENMKAISFEISSKGRYRLAPLTPNTGTCTVKGDPDFTAVWNGDAKSVTITVGDKADYGTDGSKAAGQLCFTALTVSTEATGEGGEGGEEEGGEAIVLDVNYAEATYYEDWSEEGAENFSIDFMYYNAEEDSVHAPYISFDIYSASATAISGSYSVANATIGTEYSYVVLTDAELVAEADGFDITDATLTLAYVEQEETEDGDIVYLYDAAANFTANGKKYAIKAQVPLIASKALDANEDGYYDSWVAYELIEEATAIRTIEIDNTVYARDGRIYAEEGARIYSLTGLDVTRMNGNLEGIYIVKNGNKVAKVAVAK